MSSGMDSLGLKRRSEEAILAAGGQICDWLPTLDETTPRPAAEVAERSLAMHGLLQLFFGAPKPLIRSWIECNGLRSSLSQAESVLLSSDEPLSETERRDVYWYIEALWALVWVGSRIDAIPPTERVGNTLASLLPSIKANESKAAFLASFAIRSSEELRPMLDLYYRAHWYARNGHLNGYSTEPFDLDVIMERRKALEWVCDASIVSWDSVPCDT